MVIVGNVIIVDEAVDEVILEVLFLMLTSREAQGCLLMCAQMLDEQVSIHRLVVDTRHIQRERMKRAANLALRDDEDARNVDGLIDNHAGGLLNNRGDIRPLVDASYLQLHRGQASSTSRTIDCCTSSCSR